MNEWLISAIIVVIGWLGSACISYGVTKARINGLAEDIRDFKSSKYISRDEYENRHRELVADVRAILRTPRETGA